MHAGVKAGRIRCRPHDPVDHAQQHEQDQAGADQHQRGDDEIVQDGSVAVRHLDRPDQPAGDQEEQRDPVPDPGRSGCAARRPCRCCLPAPASSDAPPCGFARRCRPGKGAERGPRLSPERRGQCRTGPAAGRPRQSRSRTRRSGSAAAPSTSGRWRLHHAGGTGAGGTPRATAACARGTATRLQMAYASTIARMISRTDGLTAKAGSGDQVTDQDNAKDGDQFQDEPGEDQGHAFQQGPGRRAQAARHRRFDVDGLGWSDSLGFSGLAAALTPASSSSPTSSSSSESGDVESSDAGRRMRGARPSRLAIGRCIARRRPYSAAAAAASTSATRHETSTRMSRANRVGRHHHHPAVEQRQALHRIQRVHRLVAEMVDEGRRRQQDLGPQAVGCERDFQTLAP